LGPLLAVVIAIAVVLMLMDDDFPSSGHPSAKQQGDFP